MKNNLFIKKPKRHLFAILVLIFGLFVNEAVGQETFTWTGSNSTSWADTANWTQSAPGVGDNYPAQSLSNATVIIEPTAGFAPTAMTGTYTIAKLTVNNKLDFESGATLTIPSGAFITASGTAGGIVTLAGGNIINNGSLTVNTSGAGAVVAFSCTAPIEAPDVPTTYGYSGSGSLTISVGSSTVNNSAAIGVQSAFDANTTYRFLFDGTTSFSLGSAASYVIRQFGGGAVTAPLVVGGAGFTHGTIATPKRGGLLSCINGGTITVNAGTTIETVSIDTNAANGIQMGNSTTITSTIINNGVINISGSTLQSGISLTTFTQNAVTTPTVIPADTTNPIRNVVLDNNGTINVNVNAIGIVGNLSSALAIPSGTQANTNAKVWINNFGTLNLVNTSVATGLGQCIFISTAGQRPLLTLDNKAGALLSMSGTTTSGWQNAILINAGTLNSDAILGGTGTTTNASTGIINFDNSKLSLTVDATAAATIGAVYTNGGNKYTVIGTKVGTRLVVVSDTGRAVGTGTLILSSGTGDASIAWTAPTVQTNFIQGAGVFTNNGTINSGRGTGGYLARFGSSSTLVLGSTSVIAPGGTNGYGFISFTPTAAPNLVGTIKLQIGGNTAAGGDYDQIRSAVTDTGFDVTGAILDVTGISGTASPVDIILANGLGTITGPFASVSGLTTGWSVDYSTAGKVQLVYSPAATTWTGGTSTGWINAANWSNGVPVQTTDVTIGTGTFQPSPFVNVSIKSLTIDFGASLQINPGFNFTVKEVITNNGTLTITNNGNLIQVDNVANGGSGSTIVNRNSNPLYRLDYTLWSSPVSGTQTLAQFSPLTSQSPNNRFFTYDPSSNLYVNVAPTIPFATGTGYLIRMPNTDPTTDYDAGTATLTYNGEFTGTPNNGTVPLNSLTASKYYSVGNPYPSTISADAFINGNSTDGTLYFWRKKNAAAGSAYATYNLVGETVTAAGSGVAGEGSAAPNGTIQVGQGFIVKTASTSLAFTNLMRLGNTSTQFFKTKQVQKDRVWLNLTRPASKIGTIDIPEVFSQALIGYMDGATLGVDNGIDGKYINDSETALTSSINEEEYTIQGRPAFDPTDVVALNFKNDADVVYTIALDHFDGVFATGQDIYLLDSKTGIETDLKAGSYTFAATAGVDNARFSLKYQKTLKVEAPAFNENSVSVYSKNGTLYVNSKAVAISNIQVYDVQGRLLAEQNNVKANSAVIANLRASNQVLIVKIAGEDNNVVAKKVVN